MIITPLNDQAFVDAQARHAEIDTLQNALASTDAALTAALDSVNIGNATINDQASQISSLTQTVANNAATITKQSDKITNLKAEAVLLGVVSTPVIGAYVGGGFINPAGNMASYEAWLGASAGMWVDFIGSATWNSFDSTVVSCKAQWEPLRASGKTLTLAIPLLTTDTGGHNGVYATAAQWAVLTSGGYNAHFTRLANDLIAAGYDGTNLVVRFGHEANGNWYPWAAKGQNAAYIAGYKVASDTFRGVFVAAGKQVPKLSFCVGCTPGDFDWNLIWPGVAYADYLGMDVYNQDWITADQGNVQSRWNDLVNQSGGLGKHVSRAAIWGVPCVIDEWGTGPSGLAAGTQGAANGGDDPYFIDQMWKWMATHNYVYANYWNHTASFDGVLSTGTKPLASARYKLHWGG